MGKRLLLVLLFALPAAGAGVSALLVRVMEHAPAASSMRSYVELLRLVSVPAGLIGVLWLGVVHAAGRVARRSRTLLLHLFVPGLFATHLVAGLLVVAAASLAIAPVPLLMMAFGGLGSVKGPLVLVLVATVALGGLAALVRASLSVARRKPALVLGKVVAETDAPALWGVVRDVCRRARAEPPDHLVLGLEPNFFVTESPVRCVDGPLAGRTMILSLPLCRILRLEEVSAVLGHELAHFVGLDTRFTRGFFPVYRGTAVALRGLASMSEGGAASLARLPAVSLLSFFLDTFAEAERDLSRDRELAADRGGARLTSAEVMATALVKVHAFSDAWSAAEEVMARALREGKVLENASLLFAEIVASSASPDHLAGLDERRVAHPADSHPPLAVRLESLGTTLAEVADRALDVAPEDAAILVVPCSERLERELSQVEQLLLADRLGIAP